MRGPWLIFAILIVLAGTCLMVLAAWVPKANAHSWYTHRSDPVTQYGCCGGSDCGKISGAWIEAVDEGYHLVMTWEQAKTVNVNTETGIDAIIPWSRVQASEDGDFNVCIYNHDRGVPFNGVMCFFAPPNS